MRTGVPRRLYHFFERQCDAAPDALALVCAGERLSYGALEARANRLACYLKRRGLHPGGRAGILLNRSVHTYTTLLAILKCGAAFVPIDPSCPAERIAFIAADAELSVLVTTSEFAESVAGAGCGSIYCDRDAGSIARQPSRRFLVPDEEDALCYILYTSGSTGRPKGVAVNHSSVCNFLSVCTPIYAVGPRDRVYQGMTISFDFSIEEIWPTFAVGATLVAGPTDYRRLGPALAKFLIEQEVSVFCCVPTLLATLDRDVPKLHTILVGGEACPRDLVKRWSRPGRRMLNTYGPTEATVTATWAELRPDRPVTIGKPLPTCTVHLLDDSLRPVKAGESGEICIGGPGVACGYINRPDLTASRFVTDKFDGRPGARLYRTGDLGRFTRDGEIELLGRIDSQVKVRGYRVELAEIEAVLLECAEVENSIVTLVGGDAGEELAAYLIPRDRLADADDLKRRLHSFLRERLPIYMIPAFIEVLDALPTLPSGKADRSRLPQPVSSRLGAGSSLCLAPATPMERELGAAWGAVFGRIDLSVEADFFDDLGGHSLLAALLVSKLRHNPELRCLGLRDVYAYPTIRSLARHAEARAARPQTPASRRADRPPPSRHSGRRVLLCGVVQVIALYLLWMLLGAPLALQLSGGADAYGPPDRGSLDDRGVAGLRYPAAARGQVVAHRPIPPWPLAAVGLVLLPLVAGPQAHGDGPSRSAERLAVHAALPPAARGPGRRSATSARDTSISPTSSRSARGPASATASRSSHFSLRTAGSFWPPSASARALSSARIPWSWPAA